MLKNADILCFTNDWTAPPTSKHHLMRHLAEENRVLWVEAAGMRVPNLRRGNDWQRLVGKAKSFTQPAKRVLPSLAVYAPPSIPLPGSRLAQELNARLYRMSLARERRRLGMHQPPVLWTFLPHTGTMLRDLPRQLLVYHCVDRWSQFEDYDSGLMEQLEERLCRQADIVFASAEDLAERCRQWNPDVHYFPHGVQFSHFAKALEPGDVPEDVRGLTGPVIGFFGLIHEWVDTELIAELARRMSDHHFVLIGDGKRRLVELEGLANVHLLGRRPYDQLPAYCRAFHAAIVPFRRTALTESVNPIKLREYAAAGLPTVSTGLPEVRRCGDIALCAETADEWEAALRVAVARGSDPAERRRQSERVRDQDWGAIADRMGTVVAGAIARRHRKAS